MQTLFACLIGLQFVVVVVHDWVDLPGWTHGKQVQQVVGRRKLLAATLVNAVFPGIAAALAFRYLNSATPGFAVNYWVVYCALTVISAILMWYVPYFRGVSKKARQDYAQMYAGTRHILPARGGNPRPNLLHLSFHVLFALNLCLALALRFRVN